MITYSFSDIGSDSLYEHLYKCIKNDIINGTLSAGTKLPSKRSFASNLGISTITVENAYQQLIAEGYVFSVQKKGYYVCDIDEDSVLRSGGTGAAHPPDQTKRPNNAIDRPNTATAPHNNRLRRQPHRARKLPVHHMGAHPAQRHQRRKRSADDALAVGRHSPPPSSHMRAPVRIPRHERSA